MVDFPLLSIISFLLGAIIIGYGGVLATYSIRGLENRNKIKGAFYISLSAIVIGVGGFATSYGWKLKNTYDQKRAIIVSVARELDYNYHLVDRNYLFSRDSTKLRKVALFYPRLTTDAAKAALLSGLFSIDNTIDSSLQHLLSEIIFRSDDVNRRFQVSDDFSLSTVDRERVMEHRLLVQNSDLLTWYFNLHRELDSFLVTNYKWLGRQQR